MKYADYYDCDICNGISVGMSLFVSGCPIHCDKCFNPETWDFNYGKEWTQDSESKFIELAGREYIKRISFLGGSPLCDKNVETVYNIIRKLKNKYPNKQIWVYTGYTWETINSNSANSQPSEFRKNVLSMIDVLVDGPFVYEKRDLTLAFRGSDNQRIIDVKKSILNNEVVLWNSET